MAVIDDTAKSNSDLLIKTEGIVQIVKGRVKETVPYEAITLAADKSAIILHQPYASKDVNIDRLVELISAPSGTDISGRRPGRTVH